jgi:hypothetical protein
MFFRNCMIKKSKSIEGGASWSTRLEEVSSKGKDHSAHSVQTLNIN